MHRVGYSFETVWNEKKWYVIIPLHSGEGIEIGSLARRLTLRRSPLLGEEIDIGILEQGRRLGSGSPETRRSEAGRQLRPDLRGLVGRREYCLLVLDSVTFTPQWIRQPGAAWWMISGLANP